MPCDVMSAPSSEIVDDADRLAAPSGSASDDVRRDKASLRTRFLRKRGWFVSFDKPVFICVLFTVIFQCHQWVDYRDKVLHPIWKSFSRLVSGITT